VKLDAVWKTLRAREFSDGDYAVLLEMENGEWDGLVMEWRWGGYVLAFGWITWPPLPSGAMAPSAVGKAPSASNRPYPPVKQLAA